MSLVYISSRTKEDLAATCATQVVGSLQLNYSSGTKQAIGLPGGRSIVPILESLKDKIPSLDSSILGNLLFFLVDEREVSLDSDESNYKLINELLIKPLVNSNCITPEQFLFFDTDQAEVENSVAAVGKQLSEPAVSISAAVLGVGEDGHIASIFPNLTNNPSGNNFYRLSNSPKPPSKRITASLGLLERSKSIYGLFLGEGKRQALKKFREEEDTDILPCSVIKRAQKGLVITDLI